MGKIKDLTGQTFGQLTVLKDTGERKNRQVVWLCKCSCGKETKVVGQALRTGHTTSCGHIKGGTKNVINLLGQKFNKLTVIERVGSTEDRKALWKCQCDCGNFRIVEGYYLRHNIITACEQCTKKELKYNLKSYNKIINHKFGRLTPLFPTDDRNNADRIIWKCKCDCGSEVYVPSSSLLSGNTKSCGCLKGTSAGEEAIKNLLLQYNINFIRECSFDDLLSPKNGNLRFDFGLINKDNKIVRLIEFDGIQHFKEIKYWGGKDYLQYLQQCDIIKNNYAKNHNIGLIRLPYNLKNITIFDLLGDKYLVTI